VTVILMYHRVADLHRDTYRLAVHPDRFASHVEVLATSGRAIPLGDVLSRDSAGGVAVTFDDGYADNATVAAPLLAAASLPATWFITAGRLGRRRFWWDRLAEALLGGNPLPDSLDAEVAGRELWFDLRTPTARETAVRFLHRRLRPLPPDRLEATVDRIIAALGAPPSLEDSLTMSEDQLRDLAAMPLQEIGAHTRTHLQLRDQAESLQREEVLGSVGDLTSIIGRPVRSFAYPFGSQGAIGRLAPRLAAEAGCHVAVSTTPGRVRRRSDPHLLPRLTVQDWDGPEFAARLDQALAAR
jgi:peptidoglycan/xylan/chitin deacetylase (PgdA/CDA1 family)